MSKLLELCMKNTEDLAEVFNATINALEEVFDAEDICNIAGIEYEERLNGESETEYLNRTKDKEIGILEEFLGLSTKENTEELMKLLDGKGTLRKFMRYTFTFNTVDFPDFTRLVVDYDLTDEQLDLAHEIYDFIKE